MTSSVSSFASKLDGYACQFAAAIGSGCGMAGAAIAFAPAALAQQPNQCTDVGTVTVCDPSFGPPPPKGAGGRGPSGANNQNGAYGPSGDAPPVGGGGQGLLGGVGVGGF